jgi:hypothetical protein
VDEEAVVSGGGMSLTAGTEVLFTSGMAIAISQFRSGDRVLATNTRTGRTQARAGQPAQVG